MIDLGNLKRTPDLRCAGESTGSADKPGFSLPIYQLRQVGARADATLPLPALGRPALGAHGLVGPDGELREPRTAAPESRKS